MQATKTELLQNFAARLKAGMSRKKLTLQQIADECGVAVSTVGAWAQAKNWPQVELQPKLARLLECSISFLFHGVTEEPENSTHSVGEVAAPYGESIAGHAKKRSEDAGIGVREAGTKLPSMLIVPRHSLPPDAPDREKCLSHFSEFLRQAEREPGGLGYTWRILQKYFPLDEFEPVKKQT